MNRFDTPIAIVVAALIVAAAIAFVFRWEVVGGPNLALRLDRWTGVIAWCVHEAAENKLDCTPFKDDWEPVAPKKDPAPSP
jgi:hypothetical protein